MKRIILILLFLIIACGKEKDLPREKDCDCGDITKVWVIDDTRYMERKLDCGGFDTLYWNKDFFYWEVGSYICELQEIDSLSKSHQDSHEIHHNSIDVPIQ
jgi:hypothetical protein